MERALQVSVGRFWKTRGVQHCSVEGEAELLGISEGTDSLLVCSFLALLVLEQLWTVWECNFGIEDLEMA